MQYDQIKALVGKLKEQGGFPDTEPFDSLVRITDSSTGHSPNAIDICAYSWVLATFGEWDRAEAVARSIQDDADEQGQALALLLSVWLRQN
jgi:hypothetical protein